MFYLFDKKFQTGRHFSSQEGLTNWLASVIQHDQAIIDDFTVSKVVMTPINMLGLMAEILEKVENAKSDCEEPVEGK